MRKTKLLKGPGGLKILARIPKMKKSENQKRLSKMKTRLKKFPAGE